MARNIAKFIIEIDEKGKPIIKSTGEDFEKLEGKAKKTGGALKTLRSHWLALTAAFAAGAYAFLRIGKNIISVGQQFENFRTQLIAVYQDAEKGEEAFQWIRKFAERLPQTTDEIVGAFVILKSVGIDAGESMMQTLADVSFAMNRNIRDVALGLVSMETEVLRRLGVMVDRTGAQAIITSGNIRKVVEKDFDSMRAAVVEIWGEKFRGATKDAENTWTGLMGLFGSTVMETKATIAETLFPTLKKLQKEYIQPAAQAIREFVSANKELIQIKLEEWFLKTTEAAKGMLKTIRDIYLDVKELSNTWKSLVGNLGESEKEIIKNEKAIRKLNDEIKWQRDLIVSLEKAGPRKGWFWGQSPEEFERHLTIQKNLLQELILRRNELLREIELPPVIVPWLFNIDEPEQLRDVGEEVGREIAKGINTSINEMDMGELEDKFIRMIEAGRVFEWELPIPDPARLAAWEDLFIRQVEAGRLFQWEMEEIYAEEARAFWETQAFKQEIQANYLAAASTFGEALLILTDSQSKAIFALVKAAAVAEAIVNAHLAYAQVLAYPFMDPISKIALAKSVLAMGYAAAASIAATAIHGLSKGSGGGGGRAAGGYRPTAAGVVGLAREGEVEEYAQKYEITIINPIGTEDWVENVLVPELKKVAKRDTEIVIRYG